MTDKQVLIAAMLESSSKSVNGTLAEIKAIQSNSNEKMKKVISSL